MHYALVRYLDGQTAVGLRLLLGLRLIQHGGISLGSRSEEGGTGTKWHLMYLAVQFPFEMTHCSARLLIIGATLYAMNACYECRYFDPA